MFPEVELLGGGETSTGFVYDFHFPHSINPDTISLIEERMRQIIREKRAIRILEMVPYSAGELLKQEGHWARAEELEEAEGLVEVFQMGSFHDLCVGPCAANSAEVAAFKLLSVERMEEEGMRVAGAAHFSKEALKEFLKKLDDYAESHHMKVGEGMGLWMKVDGKIIWLEPGLKLRNRLVEFLKERLFEGAVEVSGGCHEAVMKQLNRSKIGEVKTILNECADPESGLFEDFAETQIQISFDGEDSTSLLQSIDQTLNMLGFPPSLDFRIEDGIGRSWTVAQVRGREKVFFVTLSVEKILALLIETNAKSDFFEIGRYTFENQ